MFLKTQKFIQLKNQDDEFREGMNTLEIKKVPADLQYLEEILNMIEAYLEPLECSAKSMYQIQVSVEELFTNIASYAYDSENGEVEVQCCTTYEMKESEESDVSMMVLISIKDWGKPYNPLEHPDPDFEIPFEERRIGGLGVYMVKQFMDYVDYRNEDGCNIFTIGKRL